MCFSPSRPWNGPCGWNEISLMPGLNFRSRRPVPTNGAAGAEAGDEMRQASAGLLDDLGRGRVVVRAPVAVVAVLIGVEVAIGILGVTAGAPRGSRRRCSRAGWSGSARRPARAGSASARCWRSPACTASPCSRARRRPSRSAMPVLPEVASMMILSGVSLPDASPSRIIRGRRAVLHRSARVLPLRLRVQLDAGVLALELVQADQRRPARSCRGPRNPGPDSGPMTYQLRSCRYPTELVLILSTSRTLSNWPESVPMSPTRRPRTPQPGSAAGCSATARRSAPGGPGHSDAADRRSAPSARSWWAPESPSRCSGS